MARKQIRKHLKNYIEQAEFISNSMADLFKSLEETPPEGSRMWETYLLDAQDDIADAIERLKWVDDYLKKQEETP